jgi:hypothetical protein
MSEHHPAQKRAVLSTLTNQARTTCDSGSLEGEMEHLKKNFQKNSYTTMEIERVLRSKNKHDSRDQINKHGHNTIYANYLWENQQPASKI